MKKLAALITVFFFAACFGNLLAQEQKNLELTLGAAGTVAEGMGLWILPGGAISLGFHTTKGIGVEIGGIILAGGAFVSGNAVLSPLNLERVIPYTTGGLWTTTAGGLGWNAGGGIKLKLNRTIGIRIEYRRWGIFDEYGWGGNLILFGLSFFS